MYFLRVSEILMQCNVRMLERPSYVTSHMSPTMVQVALAPEMRQELHEKLCCY